MLNIDHNAHFTRAVTFAVPDGATVKSETATVMFKVLRISHIRGFDFTTAEGVDSFLNDAVMRIDDLVDGDGGPVEWSPEVKQTVFDFPWARDALIMAYWKGQREDAAKN